MLSLDSPRWSDLQHAYGPASDTPALLKLLGNLPDSAGDAQPWFDLWSSLAHQGDVYSASFAAVPHVVTAIALDPIRADFGYFQFPAWVETCRLKNGTAIPDDLAPAYFNALRQLPSLVSAAAAREWDANFLACAMAALAASKGYGTVAEAALELTPETAEAFMEWHYNQ
jgi:hypothetical protein